MTKGRPIRLGIMGFGQTGRQIYELASCSADVEVVAIADVGKPEILHYLLSSEVKEPQRHELQGNFLVNPRFRARLMQVDRPAEMPWDIFAVDMVIDCTGAFRDRQSMAGTSGQRCAAGATAHSPHRPYRSHCDTWNQ